MLRKRPYHIAIDLLYFGKAAEHFGPPGFSGKSFGSGHLNPRLSAGNLELKRSMRKLNSAWIA